MNEASLWIGSAPLEPGAVDPAAFDVLVLAAKEWQPPPSYFPGVEVVYAPLDDDPEGMSPDDRRVASRAAELVTRRLRSGKHVIVTCWQGRNRSGLIAALALVEMHISPDEAIQMVQKARGPKAIHNPHFRNFIRNVRAKTT